ncbi:MAG TPA: SDR family oxidoreductase [Flavobacterium sp.]
MSKNAFKDKVIWITGASSGIGKEMALQLAEEKAILILTSRNTENLQQLGAQLKDRKVKFHILPFDLMNTSQISGLVKDALKLEGIIDIVVHSAGVSQRALATDTSLDVNRKIMELNYFSIIHITSYLMPHFVGRNSGSMVIISSVAGLMGFPQRSSYAASKHALKGYFETLQSELYKTNIHISLVYPGRIDTNISKNALSGSGVPFDKTDENNEVGMNVTLCSRKIISGIKARKRIIIVAKEEKILFRLWWFFPSLYYKIAYKKGIEDIKN